MSEVLEGTVEGRKMVFRRVYVPPTRYCTNCGDPAPKENETHVCDPNLTPEERHDNVMSAESHFEEEDALRDWQRENEQREFGRKVTVKNEPLVSAR